MAGRYLTPYSGRLYAVCVATWLLMVSHANPVFASSPPPTTDDAQDRDAPDVAAEQLHALIIADLESGIATEERPGDADDTLISADYLTPEAESAFRKLFGEDIETSPAPPAEVETVLEEGEPATIKARVPGLSDIELERYKRHMYRRDI